MPKIEEDGKSWLRRPKLYKGIVEPYKKKKKKRAVMHLLITKYVLKRVVVYLMLTLALNI